MKRFHVHLSVDHLDRSIEFYAALFGCSPTVRHADYAKWMLENPRLNFAVSHRGHPPGLDHFGIQVESDQELRSTVAALRSANLAVDAEGATHCCYARSNKGWVRDPGHIPWETFVTTGESVDYGVERPPRDQSAGACCAPDGT